ncbi:MAG: TetR/AcrR family transcriptional regulator [Gammaproteobacteria bacterium]|jgi:AcrR family transcriptional regulator|nr:TetR/AcrR family transcriptional regulator [Gammaproteobacteria bacterium]
MTPQTATTAEIPSPQTLRRQERTRKTILKAATECFLNNSVATVSVEEIIEAADISRGTFYKLFRHKEDVFTQIARPMLGSYGSRLAAIDSTDPREIFDRIIDVYIQIWREDSEAFSLASREAPSIFHLLDEAHAPVVQPDRAARNTENREGRVRSCVDGENGDRRSPHPGSRP